MLDIKTTAEVRNINVRAESHGDEMVPAIDVKLMCIGVPVDRIAALCPDLSATFYDESGNVRLGEVMPLVVGHKLENLTFQISENETLAGQTFKGCDIKKGAKISLQPQHVANVELQVQCSGVQGMVDDLLEYLREEVFVKLSERQADLGLIEGGKA